MVKSTDEIIVELVHKRMDIQAEINHLHQREDEVNKQIEYLRKIKLDITDECIAVIRKSRSSSGYYLALYHNGKDVVIFGINGPEPMNGYFIRKANDGVKSFNIIRDLDYSIGC